MKSEFILLYVPCRDEAEALRIGKRLVEDSLVACANILPRMLSIYEWKEQVTESQECLLLLKTKKALAAEVTEKVLALHSYETPCVAEIPFDSLNPGYTQWMISQIKD